MVVLSTGSSGPAVLRLQSALNRWPSRLPALETDGVFGAQTRARVLEFQRDQRLTADGLVGPKTMAALDRAPAADPTDFHGTVQSVAAALPPAAKATFLGLVQPIVGDPNLLGNSVAVPLVWALIFFAMLIAMMQASSNPSQREAGLELQRWFNRMRDRARADPDEVPALLNEGLKNARAAGRDLAKRVADARNECLEKHAKDPTHQKAKQCAELLKRLSQAIQDLFHHSNLPSPPYTPDNIMKGIMEAAQKILEIARDVANCMGCPGLSM